MSNIKISQFVNADELKTNSKFVIYQDGADLLLNENLLSEKIGNDVIDEIEGVFVPQTRTVNGYELSSDITLGAIDVGAYTKEETDILLASKLSYFGNWNAAIPTYFMNVVYKYNGNLYTPVVEHSGIIDPYTDTTYWKPMTSVIAKTVTTQAVLDKFIIEPHFFEINRSGTSDISLPLTVSGEIFIVYNYYARTVGVGGNVYIQEFVDENGIKYQRTSSWGTNTSGYYWNNWKNEIEIPLITSLENLIGFHNSIKNNKFVNGVNAVCQVSTGTEPGLVTYFGENQKIIITAKTVGSYPGPSASDMIYEYTNTQGIKFSALYTATPTEALNFFEECPVLTTQTEIDNFFYSNAFAKVALGGISSMHLAFGAYGYVSMRSFTIETAGAGAGAYMQVATNEYGVDYKRSYSILDGWTEWTLKDVQTDVSVGGYANNLYFSEIDSDVPTYKILSYTPDISGVTKTAVVNTSEGNKVIQNYLYPSAVNVSQIPSGVWSFTFYGNISNNTGISKLGVQYFARTTGGTENVLFAAWSNEINNTSDEIFKFENTNPVFNVNPTDRMGARILAYTTHNQNVTISYTIGDGFGAWLNNPNRIRHNQLRALNEDMAYQHINTQQSKLAALQTDSLAIYDSITNTVKLIEKKNIDEVYVGSSEPTENQVVWFDTTNIENINYFSTTGSTISLNFDLDFNKFSSNYVAGNTVAITGNTNLPEFDCDKDVVIVNNNGANRIFIPSTTSVTVGTITYNFKLMNTATITVPTGKHLELSYGFRQLNSTTFNVLIMWIIES